MFTGIIEHTGTIKSLDIRDDGGRVTIHAPSVTSSLAISNSIAVNGCCLTVIELEGDKFSADLSGETIRKTSFCTALHKNRAGENHSGKNRAQQKVINENDVTLKVGTRVNLEQPLNAGKEFGGHFVLGHVDGVGRVTHLTPEGENWWFGVKIPEDIAQYVVPKGSITIDGISLTVARWQDRVAEIAVIPYTYEHTNIRDRKPDDAVNLEGDIIGKYIERHLAARENAFTSKLSIASLIEQGF